MIYVILLIGGMIAGAVGVFIYTREEHQKIKSEIQDLKIKANKVNEDRQALKSRAMELEEKEKQFESRIVSFREFQDENTILKRDLQNIDVHLRKLQMDGELQQRRTNEIDKRSQELATRYLKESIKWVGASLTANNYVACKQRMLDAVERCRSIGYSISKEEEAAFVADLKDDYEKLVREVLQREEQTRIKARIREDEKLQREIDRELKQVERERAAIQAALDRALAAAADQHSEEVERLRSRLAEAESRSQRAMSRAQMTKAGYVYVISNIGSFGDGLFKIGMTRRLEPLDRVKELGDASVPFSFDVHMLISCDDAPTLENALHRKLHKTRLNRINPRKEYFKTDIQTILQIVKEHHGEVEYMIDAEATEYRQSLTMSEEDAAYIEGVYDKLEEDEENESVVDDA